MAMGGYVAPMTGSFVESWPNRSVIELFHSFALPKSGFAQPSTFHTTASDYLGGIAYQQRNRSTFQGKARFRRAS